MLRYAIPLVFALGCAAQTVVTKNVGRDGCGGYGCDYASLAAWETGEAGNLVTQNVIKEARLFSFHDSAAVVIDAESWTTSPTNYIRIYTDQSARHQGKWDEAKYHLVVDAAGSPEHAWAPIYALVANVRIEGLQVRLINQTTETRSVIVSVAPNDGANWISNCILTGASPTVRLYGAQNADGHLYVWNTVAYGLGTSSNAAGVIMQPGAEGLYVYNSTFVTANGSGVYNAGASPAIVKNVYAAAADTKAFRGVTSMVTSASSDATGSVGIQGIALGSAGFVSTSAGSEDFHLAAGSPLLDTGTNTSGDAAPMNFTDDIDGRSIRTGTWDVGADERRIRTVGTGKDYATIQACADAVQAGETCLVDAGNYNEYVLTKTAGTATNRITFRANGAVTMQGFRLSNEYVTVDGFDITGYATAYQGSISIRNTGGNCEIIHNTIRDGAADVPGIASYQLASNNCVIRWNTLRNLGDAFLSLIGSGHIVEFNTFTLQGNMDSIRMVGASNTLIRRNYFHSAIAGQKIAGNHPDVFQLWGSPTSATENNRFEENFILNLDTPGSQLCQLNTYGGTTGTPRYTNVKNFTVKRNVFASLTNNGNPGMPQMTWSNNTFWRMAHTQSGIAFSGSLARSHSYENVLKNNLFLAGGDRPTASNDASGFYAFGGVLLNRESIAYQVTFTNTSDPNVVGIWDDLLAKGYRDGNGYVTDAARAVVALNDVNQFQQDAAYATWKQATYDHLTLAVTEDTYAKQTWVSDYNWVAGAATGYLPKRTTGCTPGISPPPSGSFCEAGTYNWHGYNGTDPKLVAGSTLIERTILFPYIDEDMVWSASAKTLTKANAFTSYTHTAGDRIIIFSPPPLPEDPTLWGEYEVTSKVSNDQLQLGALVAAPGIDVDRSNVGGYGSVPASVIAAILGADGIPFTADDGLKPRSDSDLCGHGEGGTDIGAYSCASDKILVNDATGTISGQEPQDPDPPAGPQGRMTGGAKLAGSAGIR